MVAEESFEKIQEYIKDCRVGMAITEVEKIVATYPDDCWTLIKCASVLKVVDDNRTCQSILDKVLSNLPEDPDDRFAVALAVRNLGRTSEAYDIAKDMKNEPKKKHEVARTMLMADEIEEALTVIDSIENPEPKDLILKCEILCALDEAGSAYDIAFQLNEKEKSADSLVNLCNVLMSQGKIKEAVKIGRAQLREDKNSAESNALAAYLMYTNGKISAAANFANRALTIDYSNVRALEIMALCFIEKKKFYEAKMLAGVINNKDPTNPAVVRILDACRLGRH